MHRQLRTLVGAPRGTPERRDAEPATSRADPDDDLHKAILSGLLSHIGILDERSAATGAQPAAATGDSDVEAARPARRRVHRRARRAVRDLPRLRTAQEGARRRSWRPSSSRPRACSPAPSPRSIPAWAEPLAGDLAKRQLSEPHWSKAAGAASAYEKVTLFGVEIIPRRRVQLARFDRPFARELFVRHALVEGEWDSGA